MFTKKILEKYAAVIIWGLEESLSMVKGKFKKNDIVQLNFDAPALSLAEMIFPRLVDMGLIVEANILQTPKMKKDFFDLASKEQLKFLPSHTKSKARKTKGSINLCAPTLLNHLEKTNPKKIIEVAKARKILRDISQKKAQQGEYCWTLAFMPTKALACTAGMNLKEYENEIIQACYLDMPDPVSTWKNTADESKEIIRLLTSLDIEKLHIESENTDLWVYPGENRKWLSGKGCNIPSFEIFTSPDCRKTRGVYFADMKSLYNGKIVEGVRLEFKNGKIISVSAELEENFVKQMIATDKGAGMLGEFSLTDKRHSRISRFMANTLYDENVGGLYGNCHVAVGFAFPDVYNGKSAPTTKILKEHGFNISAIHWDLVNTENKTVTAFRKNGKIVIIYENGSFTI